MVEHAKIIIWVKLVAVGINKAIANENMYPPIVDVMMMLTSLYFT